MNRPGGPMAPPPMMNGSESPYAGGPYAAARPPQASPPGSQHPSSGTDVSRPSGGSSATRPPSSASSLGRSSDGRMGFGGGPPPKGPPRDRSSGRSIIKPDGEDSLQRHYVVLRSYLASSLRDEKGNIKPNRARDKLLRLSATQFMELSTDVYDELIRREDDRLQRVRDVPRFLLPKQNFHPKRNQARQKLSTLPIERFRQLATDVFYELERRIPRFAGGDVPRPGSSASTASRPGMRGPPGPGYRGPGMPPMSPNGMGPPPRLFQQGYGPQSPGNRSPGSRPLTNGSGSDSSSYGRPLPKTFQSNTIVPNKSTMVEEDDDDDEDAFALDNDDRGPFGARSAEDREKMETQEAEIAEMKDKIESLETSLAQKVQEAEQTVELRETVQDLEGKLLDKDQELERVRSSGQDVDEERNQWYDLREELSTKVTNAQQLQDSLQKELDQLKRSKSQSERDLHNQTDDLHEELRRHQAENEELRSRLQGRQGELNGGDQERRLQSLQEELANQEKLTDQVRHEATLYLQEMRDLSRQNDYAVEQEERLTSKISQLEKETQEWRQRYAKVKAQNKSLRASTMGLGLQASFDSGSLLRKEGIMSEDGLVKDVDITRFQLAVDELLKVARQPATDPMLDSVKGVIVCVQSITLAVGTDGYPTPSPSPRSPDSRRKQPTSVARLKAQVTGTANSLITATKQHALASGLSPVALLDAAASNLTASVVELAKAVGIRPSSASDLASDAGYDDDDHHHHDPDDDMDSFYDEPPSPDAAPAVPGAPHPVLAPGPALAPRPVESSPPPPVPPPSSHSATTTPVTTTTPAESRPSPLNFGLGRSNTGKKTNGWFGGWGRKASDDDENASPVPPTPTTNGHAPHLEDYDAY